MKKFKSEKYNTNLLNDGLKKGETFCDSLNEDLLIFLFHFRIKIC